MMYIITEINEETGEENVLTTEESQEIITSNDEPHDNDDNLLEESHFSSNSNILNHDYLSSAAASNESLNDFSPMDLCCVIDERDNEIKQEPEITIEDVEDDNCPSTKVCTFLFFFFVCKTDVYFRFLIVFFFTEFIFFSI